jgi:hypothetical protein
MEINSQSALYDWNSCTICEVLAVRGIFSLLYCQLNHNEVIKEDQESLQIKKQTKRLPKVKLDLD